MYLVTNYILPVFIRLWLGLFFGFIGAGIGYLMGALMAPTSLCFVVTMTSTVFTCGLGSSLGWVSFTSSKTSVALILISGVIGAFIGAGLGWVIGKDVYIMGGMPGIAELSGIIKGATVGGNVPPIIIGSIRIFKRGEL